MSSTWSTSRKYGLARSSMLTRGFQSVSTNAPLDTTRTFLPSGMRDARVASRPAVPEPLMKMVRYLSSASNSSSSQGCSDTK